MLLSMTHTKLEYWERKNLGLCTHCGRSPANATTILCLSCHIKKLAYNRRSKVKQIMTLEQIRQKRFSDAKYRCEHPDRVHRLAKQSRDKLKQEVLSHYGARCICCGEQGIAFLTIDHINNNGKDDRIQLLGSNKGGYGFYRKIRQMGYPPQYQVLCWNCNHAKAIYGTCPHKAQNYPH